MQSKILKVFYGEDCLPYKDQERTVHFPLLGNAFQGASQTTEIRFYIKDIGGEDLTWVANAKLPNGRIIPKILTVLNDPELEEDYALLQLTSVYTQAKGDLYISLQGYEGDEIEMEYDGYLYQLSGNPAIQATGSIKLTIAYATPLYVGDEVEEITLQEILAYFNTKLNIGSSAYIKCPNIVNIENHVFSTEDGYNAGDIIYNKQDKKFGRLITVNSQLRFQIGEIVVSDLSVDNGEHRFNFYIERYQDPILNIEEDESHKELFFDFAEDEIGFTGNPNVKFLKERTIEISTYMPTHSVELTTTQYNIISKQPSYIYWKKSDNPSVNCYYIFANEDSSYIYFKPLNVPDKIESGGFYRLEGNYLRVNKTTRLCEEQSNTLVIYSSQQADTNFPTKINIARLEDTPTSAYVYRFSLLNQSNETISYKDLDLPLESLIVDGSYDSETQSIILTLENGNTISIPVSDMISGLATTSDLEVAISGCVAKKTTSGLHAYTHNGETEGEVAITSDKGANTIVQRDSLGDIYVGTDSASKVATETYVNTQNLLDEKLANKVTSLSSSSTDTQYPSAKAVYDSLQNVRSVAEGKCETYIFKYDDTAPTQFSDLEHITKEDGSSFNDWADFQNYIKFPATGNAGTFGNEIFNSSNDLIQANSNYYIISHENYDSVNNKLYGKVYRCWNNNFKKGDIFLIINTNVPDRWYFGGSKFYELEVDLHNMVTTDTDQDITGVKNFTNYIIMDDGQKIVFTDDTGEVSGHITGYSGSGLDFYVFNTRTLTIGYSALYPHTNNAIDLGNENVKFKDLYLSGKIDLGDEIKLNYTYSIQNRNNKITSNNDGFNFYIDNSAKYVASNTSFRPVNINDVDLGSPTYKWQHLYLSGNISNGTQAFSIVEAFSMFNPTTTGSTLIKWSQMLSFSKSADTTFTFETAKTNCLNEYKAIITNSGSSSITITLPSGVTIVSNDDNIVISSNTFTLPSGVTVELNSVNNNCIVFNFNAQ